MDLNHLKIAVRFSLKTKLYTFLNIAGLAVGFAGFMVAYLYINREQSYDRSNPAFDQIYLMGIESEGKRTDKTPVYLGRLLADQLPQIEAMGRVNRFPWEVPFNTDADVFFIKQWLGADASIADMFQISLNSGQLDSTGQQKVFIRSDVAAKLFPKNTEVDQQWVTMGRKEDGLPLQLSGIAYKGDEFSNLDFECIGFVSDLEQAGVGQALVQTFIQVKKGTDIEALTADMGRLYESAVEDSLSGTDHSAISGIYLDPLKNLHLRPAHGSDTGYRIVLALGLLSSIILLLAGINFANLMLVQAQQRSREIALKKIMGITRRNLILQFYVEILLQCILAAAIAALFTVFVLDAVLSPRLIIQVGLAVFITSLIASLYPSLVLSGGNVVMALKGLNPADHHTFFRKAVLGFQFVVAFVFISTMFVVNRQMFFVRSSDAGFETEQVIYIKNLAVYGSAGDFDLVRGRMKDIAGVDYVSLASSVPGGTTPAALEIAFAGRQVRMDYMNVDFEYFETLGISLLSGRFFSQQYPADTLQSVILNETAARNLGLKDADGQIIYHQQKPLQVIGIVADSKMLGFEELIRPTIFSVRSLNDVPKVEILAKLSGTDIKRTLNELAAQWQTINHRDGDHFIYDFADEKFALLHARQEDLNRAVSGFTLLIVTVALLGLFSMAAFSIQLRQKEVGIRKVLGASWREILLTLNAPFVRIICLAILIGVPIAWWVSDHWLRGFAYRIELQWWYFGLCAILALLMAFLIVSLQTVKTIVMKPIRTLRQD
jgi:putative ABC transport system permease protein